MWRGRAVMMGVVMRVDVIVGVGVGVRHPRMLYYNIRKVYLRRPAQTIDRTKASPAKSPIIDSPTDPST